MKGFIALTAILVLAGCAPTDPTERQAVKIVRDLVGGEAHVESRGCLKDDCRVFAYKNTPEWPDLDMEVYGWFDVNPKTGSVRDVLDYME